MKIRRVPLKELLVVRGLAESPARAEALVLAGDVWLGDTAARSSGALVDENVEVRVREPERYVSRSAQKLGLALEGWGLTPQGCVCADVGSSTGGFTQVLLERGASKVFAIDVGQNELAWKLRNDPRVHVMERTNARTLAALPCEITFASIDVSFISIRVVLPAVLKWFASGGGDVATLVKPQFEAEKDEVPSGGVVHDRAVHRRVLERTLIESLPKSCRVMGVVAARPRGQSGNQEFMAWIRYGAAEDGVAEDSPTNQEQAVQVRGWIEEAVSNQDQDL